MNDLFDKNDKDTKVTEASSPEVLKVSDNSDKKVLDDILEDSRKLDSKPVQEKKAPKEEDTPSEAEKKSDSRRVLVVDTVKDNEETLKKEKVLKKEAEKDARKAQKKAEKKAEKASEKAYKKAIKKAQKKAEKKERRREKLSKMTSSEKLKYFALRFLLWLLLIGLGVFLVLCVPVLLGADIPFVKGVLELIGVI